MGVVSNIGLFEQGRQHVLSIRRVLDFKDFPLIAKESYARLTDFMASRNLLPSGCPFVCYHNADLEHLDVEMGFPIAQEIESETSEVQCRTIPGQRVVSALFQGPYEESDPLMMEIFNWIGEHNLVPEGSIYNYYLNDEERPKEELLTRIGVVVG
ncbi:MAG: GyrI-like domain-containing protein [Sphaerochaeta associata]|uniref:GyrI-like domain-containing protein n=1 Tax=Sphaerochaeta associata TaxID=1129264 RepID=UPI002B219E68|nr:GyrI-like domain-containing protein [Sphaerochaeta associata]MEA5028758.1 GyrI-like domain-containing protein [Sphaerochaeta associata]